MKWQARTALAMAIFAIATQASADVTFYEGEGFRGRVFETDRPVANFARAGFNDRASSVVVDSGRWEVCSDAGFRGRCVLLRPGSYDSLQRMGINDRISSVRPVNTAVHRDYESRDYREPEPLAEPNYEYRRRPHERIYDADVTSVRAVVGPPEKRCWVERQEVRSSERSGPNVGGAIAGAVIGGILGHQIGGGRGKDIATAGGAVAGGAIGSNVGRGGDTYDRDVRRCETVSNETPDYWDVTYDYRGVEHHVQMSEPPGRTIAVNERGEPRG